MKTDDRFVSGVTSEPFAASAPAGVSLKKTYIKPLRTIVEIDARYANQIRDLLNTASAPAGDGGEVKLLEWEEQLTKRSDEDPSTEVTGYEAETAFGTFYTVEVGAALFHVVYDYKGLGAFETEIAAKAAAQADYEQRIRSALYARPAPAVEVREALESAANWMQRYLDTFGELGDDATQANIDDWHALSASPREMALKSDPPSPDCSGCKPSGVQEEAHATKQSLNGTDHSETETAFRDALTFVRHHFDPQATSVPNAQSCLTRINAVLMQEASPQLNSAPDKLDHDQMFKQYRACMEILEDVPGETLADRVLRIADWYKTLSDEHHNKGLSETSIQTSDSKAVPCIKCGGEGSLYTSKYGGNDPDVWRTGACPECEGTGYVVEACVNCGQSNPFLYPCNEQDCPCQNVVADTRRTESAGSTPPAVFADSPPSVTGAEAAARTIDDVPSCGMENDWRRATPTAGGVR